MPHFFSSEPSNSLSSYTNPDFRASKDQRRAPKSILGIRSKERRKISPAQLNKVKNGHLLWLESEGRKGRKADFSNTDLSGMDLSYCNFSHVNFYNADLANTNLRCSNLYKADLTNAIKQTTDLRGANTAEAIIQNNAYSRIGDLLKTFPHMVEEFELGFERTDWNTKELVKIIVGMERFLDRELDVNTVDQFTFLSYWISPGSAEVTGEDALEDIEIYSNPLMAMSGSFCSGSPKEDNTQEEVDRVSQFLAEAFNRGINIALEWRKDISQMGLGIRYCKKKISDQNTCAAYDLNRFGYTGLIEVYCTDRYLKHVVALTELLLSMKERKEEEDQYS